MDQVQDVIVHMPDNDWDLPKTNRDVENDAFSFHYARTFADSTVHFHYECQTRTNQVPVAKVAAYLKDRHEMSDWLDTTLYRAFPTPSAGVNWLMVVVACFGFAGTLVACGVVWALTCLRTGSAVPLSPPPMPEDVRLQGLGGWLILVGLGICVAPIVRIGTVASAWTGFFSQASWQLVAVPSGASYHPLYGPLLIFEVLSNVGLFGLNLLVMLMFFTKRKAFPKVYMAFLIANMSCVLLDEILINIIRPAQANAAAASFGSVVATVLWCTYMVNSRRVKATFVK
jgi:hypothetical protein